MTTILTKKKDTTGAPAPGDLTNAAGGAELAVNTFDKRLYTKDSGGNVVEIGTNPTILNIDNIQIDGNTISSTNSNGNINLTPNGTGSVVISKLNVTGDITFDGNVTVGNASTDILTITGTTVTTPNGLNFDSNTLVIDAANNRVGIGTASPAQALHINGFQLFENAGEIRFKDSGGTQRTAITLDSSNNFNIGTSANGALIFINGSTYTERMRIDGSGNVGIGTSSPSENLDVSSSANGSGPTINVSNTYYLAGSTDEFAEFQAEFYQNDVAARRAAGYMRFGKSGDFSNNANASTFLSFATRNAGTLAEHMRIDSSGRLLVGGTAASSTLTNTIELSGAGTTTNQPAYQIYAYPGTGNISTGYLQFFRSAGSTVGTNTLVGTDDRLGLIRWAGADGTDYTAGAEIYAEVDGTPGTSDMPGRIVFATTADGGSTSTERMRLDSSGNLGLGVTPSSWGTNVALQVRNASFWGVGGAPTFASVGANYYWDGSIYRYISTNVSTDYYQTSGTHVWRTAPSGTAGNAITFTQAMTLDASGNLGIGTTSIESFGGGYKTLEVAGSTNTEGGVFKTATSGSAGSGSTGTEMLMYTDSVGGKINVVSSHPTIFYTANTERMRIDSSGRLLIGGTTSIVSPTSAAGQSIQISSTASNLSFPGIAAYAYRATGTSAGGMIVLGRSKSDTVGTLAATASGDALGYISFEGVDTSNVLRFGAYIAAFQDGAGGASNIPGRITFWTGTSSASPTERMRIDSSGNVGIGNSSPPVKLSVSGEIRNTSSADASPFTQARLSAYIDASNWGYIGYGNDAIMRIVYARTASNYALRFGTTDATDNTGTFTENLRIGDFGIGLKNSSVTDGTGITFPATQNASSNANTLDDYEEGTWTPVLQGSSTAGTYTYDTARTAGNYTKIGNTVYIRGVIRVASTTSAGSGSAQITGLPFPTINPDTSWGRLPGSLALQVGPTLANSSIFVTTEGASSTYLTFGIQGTATWTAATVAEVATTDAIWFFEIQYNVS